MPAKRTFSLRRCYGIFFLAVTIALGCLFTGQAADLYFSAVHARNAVRAQAAAEGWSQPDTAVAVNSIPIYSRQIVAQRLNWLLPFVCIWVAVLVGAIVIALVCPDQRHSKADPDVMLDEKLAAARRRLPTAPRPGQQEAFTSAMEQYRRIRKWVDLSGIALAVVGTVCLVFPFLYLADFSHFPGEEINGEVIQAVRYALPFLAVLLAAALVYIYIKHRLMKKEQAAIKAVVAVGERVSPAPRKATSLLPILRLVMLVLGLGLFVLGTRDGSMYDVLTKATKICTECIGLG